MSPKPNTRPRSKSSPICPTLSSYTGFTFPDKPFSEYLSQPSTILSSLDLDALNLSGVRGALAGEEILMGFKIFLEELVDTIKEVLSEEEDHELSVGEDSEMDDSPASEAALLLSDGSLVSTGSTSAASLPPLQVLDLHALFESLSSLSSPKTSDLQASLSSFLETLSSRKVRIVHSLDSKTDSLRQTLREYFQQQRLKTFETGKKGIEDVKESLSESITLLEKKLTTFRSESEEIKNELLTDLKSYLPSPPSVRVALPSLPSSKSLREYFSEESERISGVITNKEEEARYTRAIREGAKRLLSYDELPNLWRNNSSVIGGYRFVEGNNWKQLLHLSFLTLHNESLNIHTHLLPSLFIIFLALTFPLSLPKLIFLLSALVCLSSSAGFHVCSGSGSKKVYDNGCKGDYLGISILITGSVGSMCWWGFEREHWAIQYAAITLFTLVALLGAFIPILPFFDAHKNFRIIFYLSLVACLCTPILLLMYQHGPFTTLSYFSPVLPSLYSYLTGLVFYATNFPEVYFPGKFDLVGHSHQFWHLGILGGVWWHWLALGGLELRILGLN